jgi:hypothetical protein
LEEVAPANVGSQSILLLAWPTSSSLDCHSAKGVGDREILETYLNSASKNISKIDIFTHGTKSLLTSVIGPCQPAQEFV